MQMRHGGLVLDLPEGWSDRSTLLFTGPREKDRPGPAMSVHFLIGEGKDPRGVLIQEFEKRAEVDPDAKVLEEGEFTSRLGQGWCLQQVSTLDDDAIRQVSVCFAIGPVCILAHATCDATQWDTEGPVLMQALSTIGAAA